MQHIKRYNGFLYASKQGGAPFDFSASIFESIKKSSVIPLCKQLTSSKITKEFALICACSRWLPLNITMRSQTCYILTVFVVSDQRSLNLSLAGWSWGRPQGGLRGRKLVRPWRGNFRWIGNRRLCFSALIAKLNQNILKSRCYTVTSESNNTDFLKIIFYIAMCFQAATRTRIRWSLWEPCEFQMQSWKYCSLFLRELQSLINLRGTT